MLNRYARSVLWFVAFGVCFPVGTYGAVSGRPLLAIIGWGAAALLLGLTVQKLVCPNCHRTIRPIGMRFSPCPYCGTEFPDPGT